MIQNIVAENSTSSQQSIFKNVDEFTPDRHTIARVEMNFEKLPIWSPKPKRATVFTPSKTIELEPEKLATGEVIRRKVEIVPSAKFGYPTTQTQEYWYAIQKLWYESPNRETGRVEFSRRQIIEDVLGKTYGRDTRRALDLSLNQLGTTRFEFDYVFYDKEKDETHREVRKFHLINEERLTEKKTSNQIVHDKCSVTLHPLIVSNLRSGYFKPILLSVVSQIRSDTARLLYRKLDTQFSHHSKYEISSERFFREHGLQGSEYGYPSTRKRLLERAIKELIGKPTSSGAVIDRYEFLRTADGKDWKLIVRAKKGKSSLGKSYSQPPKEVVDRVKQNKPDKTQTKSKKTQSKTQQLEQQSFTFKEPELVPEKTEEKSSSSSNKTSKKNTKSESKTTPPPGNNSEVEEVLEHFRTVFFNGNTDFDFNKKDANKAAALIEKYGLEKTKAIITQAKVQTDNDRFRPKTLAGLGKYINDALKAAEDDERQARVNQQNIDNLLNKRLENQRLDHQKIHAPTYFAYVHTVIDALIFRLPEEYKEFQEQEMGVLAQLESEVENASPSLKKIKEIALRFSQKPEQKALRAVKFFEKTAMKIPNFWQWDSDVNPQGLNQKKLEN